MLTLFPEGMRSHNPTTSVTLFFAHMARALVKLLRSTRISASRLVPRFINSLTVVFTLCSESNVYVIPGEEKSVDLLTFIVYIHKHITVAIRNSTQLKKEY
mgnify:CR=1 FL=1